MAPVFNSSCEVLDRQIYRYTITRNSSEVSYAETLNLWQDDEAFLECFDLILLNAPFSSYCWETPPITHSNINRQFEFVLVNAPDLTRRSDPVTFEDYFTRENTDEGIVAFDNLGGDATLVVPSPCAPDSAYGHLAAFIRGAPDAQKAAFWKVTGRQAQHKLAKKPLWISTAGGGVTWLHLRLDSYPKYYRHREYIRNE